MSLIYYVLSFIYDVHVHCCVFILTGANSISEDPKSAGVPSFVYYIQLFVYFNRGLLYIGGP